MTDRESYGRNKKRVSVIIINLRTVFRRNRNYFVISNTTLPTVVLQDLLAA